MSTLTLTEMSRKGGLARAAVLSKRRRVEIATKASKKAQKLRKEKKALAVLAGKV